MLLLMYHGYPYYKYYNILNRKIYILVHLMAFSPAFWSTGFNILIFY